MLVNRVDPLYMPRHNFDASFFSPVTSKELMVRLQVQHARRFSWIHRCSLMQMPGKPFFIHPVD